MSDRRRLRLIALASAVALLAVGAVLLRLAGPDGHGSASESPPAAGEPRSSDADQPEGTGRANEHVGPPTRSSRDEASAVAAAVSYAAASQRWLYLTDDEIDAAVAEIATPNAAERLTDDILADIRSARDELVESSGRVWWLVHPLAWRVEHHDRDGATVEVWTMTLLSASDVALPQTEWLTATLDLEWVDGGWRLAAARETPGPTPMTGPRDEPWQPEPFDDALAGFTRLDGDSVLPNGGS